MPYRFVATRIATHAPVPRPVTQQLRGCSSMVEQQPSKLKIVFFIVPHSATNTSISGCFCSPYMVHSVSSRYATAPPFKVPNRCHESLSQTQPYETSICLQQAPVPPGIVLRALGLDVRQGERKHLSFSSEVAGEKRLAIIL